MEVHDAGRKSAMESVTLEQQKAIARARARARARASQQAGDTAPSESKPGMMESAARGYLQGGTGGFSDEIMGGIGALYARLARPELFEDKSTGDMYREGRDIARQKESAAQEANPVTYGLSMIGGGVTAIPAKTLTPFSTSTRAGRVGNAMATGGMYGLPFGLGTSEADITKGEVGQAALDTTKGAGLGMLAGGALQGVFEAPGALMSAARSAGKQYAKAYSNMGEEGIKRSQKTAFAKEGGALEGRMGIKFSEAERTGNQRASVMEDWLANRAQTADRVAAAQKKKVDALTSKFNKTLSNIDKSKTGDITTGMRIQSAYDEAVNSIRQARGAAADADFKLADNLAGKQPFIQPNNFLRTLESFISEGQSRISTPAQRAAARQAQTLYKRLVKKTLSGNLEYTPITITEMQNGLSSFGGAAKSPDGIWKGIATAGDRRFAANAFKSLLSDLDEAASGKYAINSDAVNALKKARDNYRAFSQQLDSIEGTVLGKYLGSSRTPEDVANSLKRLQPSEIGVTLKILDKHSPDTANNVRRYMIERAMRVASSKKGQQGASARGAGEAEQLSIANMLKELPDDKRLTAILGNRKAAKEIRDIAAAFERLEKYGGWRRGSQTGQRNAMEDIAGGISLSDLVSHGWYARMIAQRIAPDEFANILLNDGARKSFIRETGILDKAARVGVSGGVKKIQNTGIVSVGMPKRVPLSE